MTKAPFDLDILMSGCVIVHVPCKEAAGELAAMLHNPRWNGHTMSEIWHHEEEETCYRIRMGVWVNWGNLACYQYGFEHYSHMVFDGVTNDLPEVGDLI